jgi:hypothetical protein
MPPAPPRVSMRQMSREHRFKSDSSERASGRVPSGRPAGGLAVADSPEGLFPRRAPLPGGRSEPHLTPVSPVHPAVPLL